MTDDAGTAQAYGNATYTVPPVSTSWTHVSYTFGADMFNQTLGMQFFVYFLALVTNDQLVVDNFYLGRNV